MSVIPSIGRMRVGEAEELNHLFVRIVEALPYYNNTAKRGEIAKYSPESLRDLAEKDPDAVTQGRIPYRKAGDRTIFLLEEILEWTRPNGKR